jgi:hypothetical protein
MVLAKVAISKIAGEGGGKEICWMLRIALR